MNIVYCDRCGLEHRDGVKGGRVVRVTFAPMGMHADLCGDCRSALATALYQFLRISQKEAA